MWEFDFITISTAATPKKNHGWNGLNCSGAAKALSVTCQKHPYYSIWFDGCSVARE
jgi:hypothetical protein